MNICAKCRFFIGQGPIWYDQYCAAVVQETSINPQTGEKGYVVSGTRIITQQRHPYARDINPDGRCILYREEGITYTDEASTEGTFTV